MKKSPARFFVALCGLILSATVSAHALSISPPHVDVIAGDTAMFEISGLPTDTNYAPAEVYLTSFDPDRLEVISPSPLSQIAEDLEVFVGPEPEDTETITVYHARLPVHFAARYRMDGLFDPIPVSGYVVRRHLHDDTLEFIGYIEAQASVLDPILDFYPDILAVQTPNVKAVVLQRSIHAFASLTVSLSSDVGHVLGLGADGNADTHTDQLELTFDPFEVNKVFYVSGRGMAEDQDAITGLLMAQVGSYTNDRPITVTRNEAVILQPVPYSHVVTGRVASIHAGDAFNLLVTRTAPIADQVSDYTVTLTSDRPSVAGVPPSVVIPAGAASVAFPVSGHKPGDTVIRATGPNAETVSESAFEVIVHDPLLDYAPAPLRIDEGDTALLTIHRPNSISAADLTLDLESLDPSLFQPLSAQLVLPAGHVSGTIGIEALAEGSNTLAVAVGTYRTNIPVRVAAATPGIRVFLEPSDAGAHGAAWRVNGGPWRSSGVLEPLDPGVYTIQFSDIGDWIAPPDREAEVVVDSTTKITATYTRAAGLRVTLAPPEAIVAGAQWRVSGDIWRDSGELVHLTPGVYQIEYRDLGDLWITPPTQTVHIQSEQILERTTTYEYASGVMVDLLPAGAVAAGAQWRIGDGDWRDDGEFAPAEPGEHRIAFRNIDGWLTPPPRILTVFPSQAARLTASYQEDTESGLIMYLEPPNAAAAGARWRIEGGVWQESGSFLPLSPGEYRIEFREIDGWLTPPWMNVEVGPDVATSATVAYVDADVASGLAVYLYPPAAVQDGAAWRAAGSEWQGSGSLLELDGSNDEITIEFRPAAGWLPPVPITLTESVTGVKIFSRSYHRGEVLSKGRGEEPGAFNRPTGLAFDADGRLLVADSRNHRLQRLESDGRWTVIGGEGTAAGEFKEPFAVLAGAGDDLYVSEIGNNRLQRRDPNGTWSVLGGPGSGIGEFNGPFDIALDPAGNLYVADLYNNRVQRRNASDGLWSVAIDTGTEAEAAWMPSGLAVWDGQLALADFMPVGGKTRVMLFADPRDDGTLIGGSMPDEGNLQRVYGLSAGPGDRLLAAGSLNNRIVIYSQTDPVWRLLIGDILSDPRAALWRSENGMDYCYIADTGNHRVLRVQTPAGALTPASSGSMPPDRDALQMQIIREPGTVTRTTTTATEPSKNLVIRWQGRADVRYTLQFTEQPLDPSAWTTLPGASLLPGQDGLMEYEVNGDAAKARFFRIIGYSVH